jgi:hypothetical protein
MNESLWGNLVFERLSKLYDQATGGARVAADPNNRLDGFWPEVDDAAGVGIASEWFRNLLAADKQALYFLVGGPGGGKSHVAARLVSGFPEIGELSGKLAHRSHLYSVGKSELLLINDATITDASGNSKPLVDEIGNCLDSRRSMIACVNRGILVEELAASPEGRNFAEEILNWISGSQNSQHDSEIVTLASCGFVKFGLWSRSGYPDVSICVSYVDVCSLFEKRPEPKISWTNSGTAEFNLGEYRLTKLVKRKTLNAPEVSGNNLILRSANAVAGNGEWPEPVLEFNPIESNLSNLCDERLVASLGTIMRSAEIYSGQRFTYREIWGAASKALIGDLSTEANSSDIAFHLSAMQPDGSSSLEKFRKIQKLAEYRYHQALFAAKDGKTINNQPSSNPISRLLSFVDPIRDSQLGKFDSNDERSGWVTPILDAFSSSYGSASPLESVLSQVSKNPEDLFPEAVTAFDRQLDFAYLELIGDQSIKDQAKGDYVRWYSTYLSRLYAVANGISAFRDHIATWVQTWLSAPAIPGELERQMLTLLRPRLAESADDSSYIPIFDSRTSSITTKLLSPKLAARLNDVKVSTMKSGDAIILTLREHGNEVADLLLDFSILRDALVCTADDVGVSDVSAINTPRLERLRAARLTPKMMSQDAPVSIVHGLEVEQVVVSDVK